MTETPATTPTARPVFPPGRYGHRRAPRRRRRWLPVLAALATVAGGLVVAVRLNDQYGSDAYDTQLVRFTDVTDTQVVVHFRVKLPAGQAATCVVRARNRAGAEVGRAELRVPPNASRRPLVSHRLATTQRPVTGEIQGCRPAP